MTVVVGAALAIGTLVVGVLIGWYVARWRAMSAKKRATGAALSDLLHQVMDSMHNGIVVLDDSGNVIAHNPRAAALGVVRDEQIDSRAYVAATLALRTKRTVDIDLSPDRAPSGREPTAIRGEVRPLKGAFTVVDVTDESEAVRLEAIRRDFVANVSHELKTPVGALALLAEAVLDATDDPMEVRRFGEKIRNEATRLGRLVTELIALSRLQGAEQLPELTEVSVDAVIEEALARSEVAAEAAGIEITSDAATGLLVSGDRPLLVTALTNLLHNAIAYSPAGGPVSISRRLAAGYVEIAVTDRGIGIAPEQQQRVFERFYRVDPARSRATGGTGLGLAIVKHVAANHAGDVTVWSKQGIGSTFTLRIPERRTPAGTDRGGMS